MNNTVPQIHSLEHSLKPSILSPLKNSLFKQHQVEVWLKRDDLLHPIISGNKWRKLKYSLNHALSLEKNTLISMGGAYSNHLHALAFTGKLLNLKTRAFIRGERPKQLNPTLKDIINWGMKLDFINRRDYRALREFKTNDTLPNLAENEYWIPEGGALSFALQGVVESIHEINQTFQIICAPCGTGTTLAGVIQAVSNQTQVLGFSALKGSDFLEKEVTQLLASNTKMQHNWSINTDYHFGGFAKTTPELLDFIQVFEKRHQITLEPIYSGKMLFGLYDLIAQDYFKKGSQIIAIHTGGLQGNRGFNRNSI